MRWNPGGTSRNIEDRRGSGIGRPMGIGGGVVLLVLSLLFGRNLFDDGGGGPVTDAGATATETPVNESPAEKERVQFVSFVLDDVQATWTRLLPQMGTQYPEARLVLFRDRVQSACGVAGSASGPFYCSLDQKAYIDLGFFDDLQRRFGANGDFAQAYVLAHEIGHHVQHVIGTSGRVREMQERQPAEANQLSVRLELQADCFAGVWANATSQRKILEEGDVEEALNAAAAIGDDRLQKQSSGTVRPESFTHGTSAQRMSWFRRGFSSGDPKACDTFAATGAAAED
jgi:predicted metalloprotease